MSTPAVSHVEWGEATVAIEWFLASEPPAEAFVLRWGDRGIRPAVTITDPRRFWRDLRTDIVVGAGLGRDHVGAVRNDLRRLHGLFGGHGFDRRGCKRRLLQAPEAHPNANYEGCECG